MRRCCIASLCIVFGGACDSFFSRADLRDFVETGLYTVSVGSLDFSSTSSSNCVPSGSSITGSIVVVNPKAFDVTYNLRWNVSDGYFSKAPELSSKDATHLDFSFTLDSTAEHKNITFTLGMYVASINRTYESESFSVSCDSPPHAASRVATLVDANQKSILAILLPSEETDDDLSKVRITWNKEDDTNASSVIYDIASLSAEPPSNPFNSTYDCYFQSSDCEAGYGYAYSVVVIDEAGQASEAVTTSSSANVFYLNYDGNGNTSGAAPVPVGYRYGATATIASIGDLAKTDYAFGSWNTAADGSGASYGPGDDFVIPAGETTLYAQWYTDSTEITFDISDYTQSLSFSPSSVTVAQGNPVTISCGNSILAAHGSDWIWYVDGASASAGGSSFAWTPASVGQHVVSCAVTYNGICYSGFFRATVTQ